MDGALVFSYRCIYEVQPKPVDSLLYQITILLRYSQPAVTEQEKCLLRVLFVSVLNLFCCKNENKQCFNNIHLTLPSSL